MTAAPLLPKRPGGSASCLALSPLYLIDIHQQRFILKGSPIPNSRTRVVWRQSLPDFLAPIRKGTAFPLIMAAKPHGNLFESARKSKTTPL